MGTDCHCGNPSCAVPRVAAAVDEFVSNGGDPADMALLWCTAAGCHSFELVTEQELRRLRGVARCPDHQEGAP